MAIKFPNEGGNVPQYNANTALTVLAGDIKTGKTTFAASAGPSMLILDFEQGTRLIDGCQSIEIESLADLKAVLERLEKGDHPYKTVAVDSVTAMIGKIEAWAVDTFKEIRRPDSPPLYTLADVEFGQGYKRAAVQLANIINRFHALQKKGIGTLLICHTELQITTAKNGTETKKEVPNLSRHYQYPVLGRADSVLHIRRVVERDNSVRRIILTQPDLFSAAVGCRFHGLPRELEADWNTYAKAVKAGAAQLREKRKAAKPAAKKRSVAKACATGQPAGGRPMTADEEKAAEAAREAKKQTQTTQTGDTNNE